MKIIFLDIDGVLAIPDSHFKLDDVLQNRLLKILKDTNARIVISSSWRCKTLEQTKRYLELNGCRFVTYIIDHTQKMHIIRGREIQEWLDDNHHKVETYCIIDDDSDMLVNQNPLLRSDKT